jgi:hypothetical protein
MADEVKFAPLIPAELYATLLKDGWETSEFKVTLTTKLLGAIAASGLIPSEGPWFQIAGLVVIMVADVAFTALRSWLKKLDLEHRAQFAALFSAPPAGAAAELTVLIEQMRKKLESPPTPSAT